MYEYRTSRDDADSVHSMTRTPPSMSGSPKPSFLSNGIHDGTPPDYDDRLNSDSEDQPPPPPTKPKPKTKTKIPPRVDLKKNPRERYWGVTNGK